MAKYNVHLVVEVDPEKPKQKLTPSDVEELVRTALQDIIDDGYDGQLYFTGFTIGEVKKQFEFGDP
jgi:hypothetical protein